MLRTAALLPLTGLSTLGFDAGRFPPTPPVCYRASWQLPGPDFHRQATTSLRLKIHYFTKTSEPAGRAKDRGYRQPRVGRPRVLHQRAANADSRSLRSIETY